MARFAFYKVLEIPTVYSLTQFLLLPGATRMLKKPYRAIFGESRGLVLDVGCGPALTTPVPKGKVVGIDINPRYIKEFTGGYIDEDPEIFHAPIEERKTFGFVGSADRLPFNGNQFDESRCMGIFHHLPDDFVRRTMKEMARCTKPGGKIVIIDNVWPANAWLRPIAWAIRKLDRGEWVRSEQQLTDLVKSSHSGSWKATRFTYTLNGLELIAFELQK